MYTIKKDILTSTDNDRLKRYIKECENEFEAKTDAVVEKFISDKPALAALAGPSCSGKTTTAGKIISKMKAKGHRVKILSTDDFFFDQEKAPLNPDGTKNFDHFDHVDSELLLSVLHDISKKKKVMLPLFDFNSGKRCKEYVPYDPNEDDVVILEGIHALNDHLIGSFDPKDMYGIYICVSEGYHNEKEELFEKFDIRLIRRIIRDKQFRNADAERTFALWKNVRDGEVNFIDPFIRNADIHIHSMFEYEPAAVKDLAIATLSEVKEDSRYFSEAQRLISLFDDIPSMDTRAIPEDSLLREFIGARR